MQLAQEMGGRRVTKLCTDKLSNFLEHFFFNVSFFGALGKVTS